MGHPIEAQARAAYKKIGFPVFMWTILIAVLLVDSRARFIEVWRRRVFMRCWRSVICMPDC